MRLRNKPWALPLIKEHSELVKTADDQQTLAGNWQSYFPKKQPLHLEIGSGKGRFIINMAQKYPQINFIGMELQTSAVGAILKELLVEPLPNLRLFLGNGAALTTFFAAEELSTLYLNFSDPWPKTRHAKRRLTHISFLNQYQQVLAKQAPLIFKTDNVGLFNYSVPSLSQAGWVIDDLQVDLHQNRQEMVSNIETEYEQRFSAKGQPIFRVIAHYPYLCSKN